jgi:hypothetical protein
MGMTMRQHRILLAGLLLFSAWPVLAEREPVSAQIQLPHNYYYREMYLPPLTIGVDIFARWQGAGLQYGGSLWRQTIGSDQARELTHAGATTTSRIGHMMVDILYSLRSPSFPPLTAAIFNLYVAGIAGALLSASKRLVPEHTSTVYRYYYLPTDHAINPSSANCHQG